MRPATRPASAGPGFAMSTTHRPDVLTGATPDLPWRAVARPRTEDRVRAICLALPEIIEKANHGAPASFLTTSLHRPQRVLMQTTGRVQKQSGLGARLNGHLKH